MILVPEAAHRRTRPVPVPRRRSAFRLWAGRLYFTWLRYMAWQLNHESYANTVGLDDLPFTVFRHQTPLLRRLRNVDMWLQYNKVTNLKIAVARLNGIVLRPGDTFSFWRLVGRPSRRKGYTKGMVISNGSFRAETGGGLCQLSNLIYWMTLHTPLTVTERWRHDYDVFPDSGRAQPFGSGATVAYNYVDLQLRNDTFDNYQLKVYVGKKNLHGEWLSDREPDLGYLVYEAEHRITHEPWGGYVRHNALRRQVQGRDGTIVEDQFITENHALMMYEPMLPAEMGA